MTLEPTLESTSESTPEQTLDLKPEERSLNGYVEDTIVIDWQTPTVATKARELCEGTPASKVDSARVLFEFVRDEIGHSIDVGSDAVPCNASQVLREGSGLCYAKSHLLAALLRARGIPAGFGYQRMRQRPPGEGFVLHGFVVAQLGEPHGWVALDARGNNERVETEFRLDAPSLAYEPDEAAGEVTYPSIFSRPSKRIVDFLERAESLRRVLAFIPGEI